MKKFGPYRGYSYPQKPSLGNSNYNATDNKQKPPEPISYNKLTLKELGKRYEDLITKHKQLSESLSDDGDDNNCS